MPADIGPTGSATSTEQQLKARLRQQAALARLGLDAVCTTEPDALFRHSLEAIATTLDVQYCALLRLTPEQLFETVAVYGWEEKWIGTHGRADAELQPGFTLQAPAPVRVADYASEQRFRQRSFLTYQKIISGISTAIRLGDRPWGVIVAHSCVRHDFSDDDAGFMQSVAALLAGTVERLQTQARLQESERNMRAAQRLAHLGSWETELEGGKVFWTEEMYRIYGVDPASFTLSEASVLGMLPDDALAAVRQLREQVLRGGVVEIEHRIVAADGSERFVRQRAELVRNGSGRPARIAGTTLDITALKRSESALNAVATQLQTTLESMADAFLTLDREWRVTYMNARAEQLLRRSRQALLGKVCWLEFGPTLRAALEPRYQRVLDTGRSSSFVEYHEELEAWLETTVYPSPEGLAIYFRNVSERVLHEYQLRQQARLLDQAKDAILVRDLEHRILFWNRGAERLYGWRSDEVRGRSVETLLYGEDVSLFRNAMVALHQHGVWSGRLRHRRRDGGIVTVEGHWTLVQEEGRPATVVSISTDISDRLELEGRLAQAQKLESIGQLTGGIAHDFNNLLTVIIGNAELLGEEIGDSPRLAPLVNLLKSAADRGAELTSHLLAFARRQVLEPRLVSPRQVVEEVEPLLRRTLGAQVQIELFHDADLWDVFIDPAQLASALLNLGINARDAMPAGGQLTIDTANIVLDETYAAQHAELAPGPYVQIAVTDTGSGIPPEILGQVFDPFFTTKEKGKGTGLGLSMVYGFVKQSGGHIKIYSELEHGTAIHIYLPRAGEHDRDPALPPLQGTAQLGGSEHILLVEDDQLVRHHARHVLGELGYRVTVAADGAQALALLQGGERFDLLFTDVIMPGELNGPRLAAAAQQLVPGLPVLFTSGYTENAIVQQGRVDPGTLLLHKPYRRQALAEKIRQALAPSPPAPLE